MAAGENAGLHTATYSAPASPGAEKRTHSSFPTWIACPASTSIMHSAYSTRTMPFTTMRNSSNLAHRGGSSHPAAHRTWAMEIPESPVLTRPTYSSTCLAVVPATGRGVGEPISLGMTFSLAVAMFQYSQNRFVPYFGPGKLRGDSQPHPRHQLIQAL